MTIIDARIRLWAGPIAPPHHWRAPYMIESALRDMDHAGVDRAVNCQAIWDPEANDCAVQAALAHPDRFATMGWFPLDGTADAPVVDAWLDRPGMLGLRFMMAVPEMADQIASGGLDWLRAAVQNIRSALKASKTCRSTSWVLANGYPSVAMRGRPRRRRE